MLRWLLFFFAFGLCAIGLLTVLQSPTWSPWQLAVLAGEYGHWLALAALASLTWGAWAARQGGRTRPNAPRSQHRHRRALAGATAGLSAAAAVLLLTPAFQAWRIARSLPEQLTAAFGAAALERAPFSLRALFTGADPVPGRIEVLRVTEPFSGSAGLPVDFYRAVGVNGRPAPCVVVVHGGGWDSGDRTQFPALNHWLTERGYAVAAISYRLAPAFIWPAQRDDLLAALAWLKNQAGALGIDPSRIVLLGRSAGGQVALATGYTAHDPAIRGVVGLYAPSDLIFGYENTHENDMLKSPALMRKFLGGTPVSARENFISASAYFHVARETRPTLLLHGRNDALSWYRHSARLDARLAENGVPHHLVLMPWATHAFDFNLHGPGGQLTTFALEWFLQSVTR